MAEGEHTIISKIPRERLNQIAGRKLSALGIPVRLGADRETLEGELAFATRILHPLGGAAISRARFAVEGHDQLRFLDPPLAALAPVPFFDVERTGALEGRIAGLLQDRAALLQDLAARLRALRLEPQVDPDRLVVRVVAKTVQHGFEIVGGPDGFHVARVAPVGGKPFAVAPGAAPLRLEDHPSLVDLELWLSGQAAALEAAARAVGSQAAPAAAPPRIEPTPPPRTALTLGALVRAFGEDAIVAPNVPVELFQEFQSGGTHYRLVAAREAGATFRGRLIGPSGDRWSERFELSTFAGSAAVVAAALGAGAPVAEPAAVVPQHLLPRAGEVWVMSVVVEAAGAEEVRYVGTDIDGRPYGAARVLKRHDFEAVFSRAGSGWRLLVLVDQVGRDGVIYRQLDPQRQPMGAPRKMATAVLVANFVPEAAAL
jgi:hypothetical protein